MTEVKAQRFAGNSNTPVPMGGISRSHTGNSGYSNGSVNVSLQEGCSWSHVQIYGITDGGDAGSSTAQCTAVLKDGTSIQLDRYVGKNLNSPGRTTFISNKLTAAQIANLDHIVCYAYAQGGYGSTGNKTGYAGAYVYGTRIPWVVDE